MFSGGKRIYRECVGREGWTEFESKREKVKSKKEKVKRKMVKGKPSCFFLKGVYDECHHNQKK